MRQKALMLLVLLTVFVSVMPKDSPQNWNRFMKPSLLQKQYTQNQYLFDQVLDHFNYQGYQSTWKQRYWVINNYFDPESGPVYLYICGQWVCSGLQDRDWVVTLAQRTRGLVLVLQHRFYGQSLPFGNSSYKIQNFKYLTSEQALSDLAYFINTVNSNHMFGVNSNPWITVGGSYPGALSAWFRYKYPHLTVGAIASSGVVQSLQNFYMFDEQIYLSANKSGDYCWKAINATNSKVQQILSSTEGANFKKQFTGGQNLKNDQFMFFWTDSIVMLVQYGHRTTMCDSVKDLTEQKQFEYFVNNAKQHPVYEYGSYYLKNQSFAIAGHGQARSWYYQSCTEFGYWQTPSLIHPLRSKLLGLDFYKRFCSDSYGEGIWPKVDRKNTQTGGWNLQAFNLMMTNGDEDPWKWASVQKSQGNIISRVANCSDCAHCKDLHSPSINDPPEIKKIRDQQFLLISQWVQNYWVRKGQIKRQSVLNKKVILTE